MLKPINKVIIDTNLWISFLLTKSISNFDKILSNKNVVLIFSRETKFKNRSVFINVTSNITT